MNLGKQALQTIETLAPTVAKALGGPLAGMAVQGLETLFGVKGQGDLEAAVAGATPDQLAALRKLEADFKVRMRELDISEEQLVYSDIASARAREIAVKDWIPGILALGVTVGFFGVLGYMLTAPKPPAGWGEALLVMLGSLGTAWAGVISYYFGSSAGAQRANEALSQIAKS